MAYPAERAALVDAEFAQARADRAAAAAELRGIRTMIGGFSVLARDVLGELKRQRADLNALQERERLLAAAAEIMTGEALSASGPAIPQPRRNGTARPPLRLITGTG
jgi:hypothetical protein